MRALTIPLLLLAVLLAAGCQLRPMVPPVPEPPLRIAFMSNRDGNFEIYRAERDGSNLVNLSNHPAEDGLPAWSPAAQAVIFASDRTAGTLALYRLDSDSQEPILLSDTPPANASQPFSAPAGPWVAFVSNAGGSLDVFMVNAMEADTPARGAVTGDAHEEFAAWSPDGETFLYVSDREGNLAIYTSNIQGGEATRLTELESANAAPDWSPDGSKIAFMSNRDGNTEIYVLDVQGEGVTRLTDNEGFDGYPAWSPDGAQIAFLSTRDQNPEIYIMNADGSEPRNLTNNPGQDSPQGDFVWSPDGSQILFQTDRDGNVEVYIMDADGSNPINVSRSPAADFSSTWIR